MSETVATARQAADPHAIAAPAPCTGTDRIPALGCGVPSNSGAAGNDVGRRTILIGAGATAAVVLGGCSGSVGDGGKAPASAPGASSAGSLLTPLDAVPVGSALVVRAPSGDKIVVARPTADTAVAFSAKCTHRGCAVTVDGSSLHCPCHGSRFEPLTGKVSRGPASSPLPAVAVEVRDGQVRTA